MGWKQGLTIGLAAYLALTVAGPSQSAQNLAGTWYDATLEQSEDVDALLAQVERQVDALDAQLTAARQSIADGGRCTDLNCGGLAQAVDEAHAALEAANGSVVLSRIAADELATLASNQRASLRSITRSKDDLAGGLLALEIAQRTAELSAGIAAALATGNSRDIAEQAGSVADTLINYAANKGLDLAVQQRTAAGDLTARADLLRSHVTQTISRSIGEQLSTVAIIDASSGAARLTVKPLATKMDLAQASQIAARVFVRTLTEPFVAGVREDFRKVLATYREAYEGQRDLDLAAEFGDVAVAVVQDRQRQVSAVANRLSVLADACSLAASPTVARRN